MDDQNRFRQWVRAVFHELFRSKGLYNALASLLLLSCVAGAYFWQERYISVANLGLAANPARATPSMPFERLETLLNTRSFQELYVSLLPLELGEHFSDAGSKREFFAKHVRYELRPHQVLRLSVYADSAESAQARLHLLIDTALAELRPSEKLQALDERDAVLALEEMQMQARVRNDEAYLASLQKIDLGDSSRSRDRITAIREAIQDAEVNINALNAKIDGIRAQLEKEESLLRSRARMDVLQNQKIKLQRDVDENTALYSADAPEVSALQQQLDTINAQIASLAQDPLLITSGAADATLYEQLRRQLTLEQVERDALLSRHESLRKILNSETQKSDTSKDHLAEWAEAESKANAGKLRLREVQEQRAQVQREREVLVASLPQYRVMDKPDLPQQYAGLGFIEFLILGPIAAFGVPLLLASALVLSDSRIRTSGQLRKITPRSVPVLGVIPHYNSPVTARIFRKAVLGLMAWGVFVFSVYITVGVIGFKG